MYNSSYCSTDEIYAKWKKDSIAAKIEIAFSLIFFLSIVLLLIYLLLGVRIGMPSLINNLNEFFSFEGKTDEEILTLLTTDLLKYIIYFFGIFMAGGLIATILGTNSFFNMAKWLSKNKIDCSVLLKNGRGSKRCNFLIGNGFLIKEKPAMKSIFYIRVAALFVIDILIITSMEKLFKNLIYQIYDAVEIKGINPLESIKAVFTSNEALVFYAALIAALFLNVIINKILRNKQTELLNQFSHSTSTHNSFYTNSTSNENASGNNVNIAIVSCGTNKIETIKYIKEFVGLGLVDAKNVAEGKVGIQLPIERAEILIGKLKNIGTNAQIVR